MLTGFSLKIHVICNKIKNFLLILFYIFGRCLPDSAYLRLLYFVKTGKRLDLKNPRTFNEKLQWLKLNDRKEEYTVLVDKFEVKNYVSRIIGSEYVIPTLGVWEKVDEIEFTKLPEKFVLKTTHDSGSTIVCKNKKEIDLKEIRKKLSRNYYYYAREWPYKMVKPRIIAEPYLEDYSGNLIDYKFFCFHGEPFFVQVDIDRFSSHKRNFYDLNWNFLNFQLKYPNFNEKRVRKPDKLEDMIDIAKKLSKGKAFVRIDLYEVNGKVYFGEMTFYPEAGFAKFNPDFWDEILGNMINLDMDNLN